MIRLLGVLGAACHIPGMTEIKNSPDLNPPEASKVPDTAKNDAPAKPREIGGPKGPEPTRYGDWEVGGRCTDF
jgi:hypothetical protein